MDHDPRAALPAGRHDRAYLEFKSPGFGVAGILSAICFLLFFAGHYIAGLTGFEVVAVFVLGLLLVLTELLFFPRSDIPGTARDGADDWRAPFRDGRFLSKPAL